ncbi:MAG: efflux transporter outer membrane subunit [Nevskia sp.]|nr:efflux transporter outer membrane subunit [Nevskia sp.]
MRFLLVATTALVLLAGCSLIPDDDRPTLPTAETWPQAPSTPAAEAAADLGWRVFFQDSVTQDLIAAALANNRDLRVAALNAESAEAQYRTQHASLFPTLDATAGFERSRTPADVYGSSAPQNVRQYSLGLSAVSWELDFFGRIRSQAQQAHETYLQQEDLRRSAQISLVASVASSYDAWLADSEAQAIARDTEKLQAQTLKLTQNKAAHGSGTALDVAQAETNLRSAQASVAQYNRQISADMDALVLLLGAPLEESLAGRMTAQAQQRGLPAVPDVPAGLPADLLEHRPDIRAAEHALRAANANIGTARAAFYPQIVLTANGGTASSGLHGLFGAGQGAWLFQPSLSLPIFDAGRNEANLDLAKIEKRIEIATYEKAIQSAFHDVADALSARETYTQQLAAQQALVAAEVRYCELADMRFRAGSDSFLNVLVSQNALLGARLSLVSLRLAAQQNAVTLYKALGGGWREGPGGA